MSSANSESQPGNSIEVAGRDKAMNELILYISMKMWVTMFGDPGLYVLYWYLQIIS